MFATATHSVTSISQNRFGSVTTSGEYGQTKNRHQSYGFNDSDRQDHRHNCCSFFGLLLLTLSCSSKCHYFYL